MSLVLPRRGPHPALLRCPPPAWHTGGVWGSGPEAKPACNPRQTEAPTAACDLQQAAFQLQQRTEPVLMSRRASVPAGDRQAPGQRPCAQGCSTGWGGGGFREPGWAQNACEHPTTRGRHGTLPAHRGQGHRPLSRNRGARPTLWACSVRDLRLSFTRVSGQRPPPEGSPRAGQRPTWQRGVRQEAPPPPRHCKWAGLQPGTCTYRPARPRPGADRFRRALCPPGDHGDRKEQELPSFGLSLQAAASRPKSHQPSPLGATDIPGQLLGVWALLTRMPPPQVRGLDPHPGDTVKGGGDQQSGPQNRAPLTAV